MQAIPNLGKAAKQLLVFQRTPSAIDIRDDEPTDPNWARTLQPGWSLQRRKAMDVATGGSTLAEGIVGAVTLDKSSYSPEEWAKTLEELNDRHMSRIRNRIDIRL